MSRRSSNERFEPTFSGPPRDTGLMLEGRASRERRRRRRAQRRALLIGAVVLLAFVAIGWFLAQTSPRPAASTAVASGSTSIAEAADVPRGNLGAAYSPKTKPTPVFAAYRDVALHLPVATDKLTEIAFHQASYGYSRPLVTRLPTFPMEKAKDKAGTGRRPQVSVADEHGWLGGSVLRLWRARPGKPDTAADVGAPYGTPVLAPVTGRVLRVKPYLLYGKYPDFEIHIRPVGHNDLDVVLIHITNPKVSAGDEVSGGITPIGAIRRLSAEMHLQLADYSRGAGDHTHVEINQVKPGTTEGIATKS